MNSFSRRNIICGFVLLAAGVWMATRPRTGAALVRSRRSGRRGRSACRLQLMWQVEVDYGDGWVPYGPPYPEKIAAEAFARELSRHGHGARVVASTARIVEVRPAVSNHPVSERKRRRRRR